MCSAIFSGQQRSWAAAVLPAHPISSPPTMYIAHQNDQLRPPRPAGERIQRDFGLPNLVRFPIVADLSAAGDGGWAGTGGGGGAAAKQGRAAHTHMRVQAGRHARAVGAACHAHLRKLQGTTTSSCGTFPLQHLIKQQNLLPAAPHAHATCPCHMPALPWILPDTRPPHAHHHLLHPLHPPPSPSGGRPLVVSDPTCATSSAFMDLGAAVVREVAKISGRPARQAVYYDEAQVRACRMRARASSLHARALRQLSCTRNSVGTAFSVACDWV